MKTEDFFARMAGNEPFAMAPWAPLTGENRIFAAIDWVGSFAFSQTIHDASGLTAAKIGIGVAACLEFAAKSGDRQKNREQGKTDHYAVEFAPAFYTLDFVDNYEAFQRTERGMKQCLPVFFRGKPTPGEDNANLAEVIPLRLGQAKSSPFRQNIEQMKAWAVAWMTKVFTMDFGGAGHPRGMPELWMWVDNGHIYGMVVPGAFYQHQLPAFLEDAAALLSEILPASEALPPVKVQKAHLGNIHLHHTMMQSTKAA